MPKQIATGTTEGIRKRGRTRQRWRDEIEEDLTFWHRSFTFNSIKPPT
jgi:hypothetical protein